MEGDGQLVKDSILKNKILKYYNPTHTRDSMKELKKYIKILKTHKKTYKEVYQNTLNTLSQLKKEGKREREMKIPDQAAMATNQGQFKCWRCGGRSRLNGGKLFVGEMTTFFLWIWRAKRDSGRGLNFSLKFGLAPFFYDFLKFDL